MTEEIHDITTIGYISDWSNNEIRGLCDEIRALRLKFCPEVWGPEYRTRDSIIIMSILQNEVAEIKRDIEEMGA